MLRLRQLMLLLLLVGTVLAGPAWCQEVVELYNKKLTATLPKGLYALTPAAIKENYPGKVPPQHVYKNRQEDYSYAFNYLNKQLQARDLVPFHTQLKEQIQARTMGIRWVNDRSTQVQGRQWEVLEFKADQEGFLLHNWIFITVWKGRVLEIAVTAFDDVDPNLATHVNSFFQSLKLID